MNHEIFISYSSKQKSVADGVCHYLEENGYKCWMAPRDIPAGSTYADLIDKAIVGSQIVVLVFSESASFSKWVKAEINVAFDEDKLILPFRIDETKITGSFRLMLNQMHWVEAFPHYADKLPILLESIGNLIGKRDRPQTSITVTEPIATIDVKPSDSPHDLKLYSDLECYFFLDGEAKGRLRAGSVKKIPLKQGEYHFLFVGADNENDLIEMDYSMPATDKLLRIALEPVRTERLRIEELRASEQRYLEQNEKIKRIEFATKGEFTVNGVAFKMIFVEGGRFLNGGPG
jgi:hypothetical protein